MQDKLDLLEDFFTEDSEITATELTLTVIVAFLLGLVLGMIFSPKGDTMIGSNNGNDNVGTLCDDAFEDED